ncbi:MAG TPA: transcription elongation factor GreA [Thermoleophilaceae bacterium]|jgi:transcription elongation factor GreA|nr:transcription elongation factor GreA [Thermoleophilaceae bacterium]
MSTEPTQITAEGLAELKAELEHLETTRRKEISERIKIARDFGDLKENSEYHDAKNEQAFLETKILKLRERLTTAVVVVEDEEGAHARFGSQVKLRDEESGKELTYRLVGATEASLADGKLSVESPVAQAIVGKMAGEKVVVPTPRGDRGYTLISVD